MRERIEQGDWVQDPISGELRKVAYVVDTHVYLEDGGILSLIDITEVFVPGEVDGYN